MNNFNNISTNLLITQQSIDCNANAWEIKRLENLIREKDKIIDEQENKLTLQAKKIKHLEELLALCED